MGHSTNIYGIISFPSHPSSDNIWLDNMKVIQELPDHDEEYPAMSNKMFSKEFQPGWEERHIHFAANYKNLEFDRLQEWVGRFERLLSKLMWYSAAAQIETDISGDFEIYWNIEPKDIADEWTNGQWVPTTRWRSDGLIKK